ncbi:MAG: hypothetical protein ABEJ78_11830 [Haloferacaceae archaeon]
MSSRSVTRQLWLVVGIFAVLGVALGAVNYVVTDWARVQFVSAASGANLDAFGPVFVALSAFQTTVTLFLAGPVVGTVVGTLVGSRFIDRRLAGGVAGGGSLVGFFVMAGFGLAGLSLVGGPGTGQVYAVGQAVGPLLAAGVATGVVGGVGGVLGSAFVR